MQKVIGSLFPICPINEPTCVFVYSEAQSMYILALLCTAICTLYVHTTKVCCLIPRNWRYIVDIKSYCTSGSCPWKAPNHRNCTANRAANFTWEFLQNVVTFSKKCGNFTYYVSKLASHSGWPKYWPGPFNYFQSF